MYAAVINIDTEQKQGPCMRIAQDSEVQWKKKAIYMLVCELGIPTPLSSRAQPLLTSIKNLCLWTWVCPGGCAKGLAIHFHQGALLHSIGRGSWDLETPDFKKKKVSKLIFNSEVHAVRVIKNVFTRFLLQNFPHKWTVWICGWPCIIHSAIQPRSLGRHCVLSGCRSCLAMWYRLTNW